MDRPCCKTDKDCSDPDDFRYLQFRPENFGRMSIQATPIRIAAANGSLSALKAMLRHPAMDRVVNDPILTGEASCLSMLNSHLECVSLLEGLEQKPNIAGGMMSLLYEDMSNGLNEEDKRSFRDFLAEKKAKAQFSLDGLSLPEEEDAGEKRENGHRKSPGQVFADIQNGARKMLEYESDWKANELLKLLKEEELEKGLKQSKKGKRKARRAAKKAKESNAAGHVTSACSPREAGSSQESLCHPRPPCLSSSSTCTATGDAAHQQDDDPTTTTGGGSSLQHSQTDGQHQDPQLVETLLQALLPGSEASPSRTMSEKPDSISNNATNKAEIRESQTSAAPKSLAEKLGLKVPIPVFDSAPKKGCHFVVGPKPAASCVLCLQRPPSFTFIHGNRYE